MLVDDTFFKSANTDIFSLFGNKNRIGKQKNKKWDQFASMAKEEIAGVGV